jgi:hypothetical protein
MTDVTKDWIDLLSIPIVEYTASVWNQDPAETWGILSRAIQNEEISQRLPLHEFVEYICMIANRDPETISIPLTIGIDYKQLFDYHIDRLGWQSSREQFLTAFDKDYKRACERLSKYPADKQSDTTLTSDRNRLEAKDMQELWLLDYKEHIEQSAERELNTPSKPNTEPYNPNGWQILGFFLLWLYINNQLWQDTNIPEDSAVFYLLISFFLTIVAIAILSLLLHLIRKFIIHNS